MSAQVDRGVVLARYTAQAKKLITVLGAFKRQAAWDCITDDELLWMARDLVSIHEVLPKRKREHGDWFAFLRSRKGIDIGASMMVGAEREGYIGQIDADIIERLSFAVDAAILALHQRAEDDGLLSKMDKLSEVAGRTDPEKRTAAALHDRVARTRRMTG